MAKKSQVQKFREAARELGTDENEQAFDDALKRVAKPSQPKSEEKPTTKSSH